MKPALATVGVLLALISAYLLLWPVPVHPVAWHAPVDLGYVDPFAQNDLLKSATAINLGDHHGPEDATLGADGRIYVTTSGGSIIRIQKRGVSEYVNTGGRPLGIEADADGTLVVANSNLGIQRVSSGGIITTILGAINGVPLHNANNIGIGADGIIYFSQSSTKFTAADYGGSYDAGLLDLLEHGGHGNIFAFDPASGNVEHLMTGINYANGVAISDDGSFLAVAETGHYRILKYWLQGDRKGKTEVLIDNLPGFPDNIKNGLNGRFWIGFAAPRNEFVDDYSNKPFVRKIVQRLPPEFRPKAEPFSHVVAINGDGEVLMNLHDPAARFPTLTGVLETRDSLYLTTLFGNRLARLEKRDLGR